MTTIPSYLRITGGLRQNLFLQTYYANMKRMTQAELEISTGRRLNTPSDDPIGTRIALNYENALKKNEQYVSNIQKTSGELAYVDGALDDVSLIVTEAREILLGLVGEPGNADIRENAAIQIGELLDELVSIANSKYGDNYVFGGYGTTNTPFEMDDESNVRYKGTDDHIKSLVADGVLMDISIPGSDVFGSLLARIGSDDLSPAISGATKLEDLNLVAGKTGGVRPGTIEVNVTGAGLARIDLSEAEDLQDVVNLINQETSGFATASLGANGLVITRTAGTSISVSSTGGAKTAEDLGIAGSDPNQINGAALNPAVTGYTEISDLLGGAGIDTTGGFTVTNGNDSAFIDVSSATTINDLITLVRDADVGVEAKINDDRTGIEIVSRLNGARLSLSEGTGTTAADLGLILGLVETPVASLNGGVGIDTVSGSDFEIRLHDGTVLKIDLSNADTVQDILDVINNHADNGGKVTADSLGAWGNGLRLTDNTAGANDFMVERLSGSFAATNLGIEKNSGAGATLEGKDLSPAGILAENLFTGLQLLKEGLETNDTRLMQLADPILQDGYTRLLSARAEVGGRMNRLEMTQNRLEEEEIQLSELYSNVTDADMAESIIKFQNEQSILQAALGTSAKIINMTLLDYL